MQGSGMGGGELGGRGAAQLAPGERRSSGFQTFRSLKNPAFRLFFGASVCQMASMNMQMVARAWYMYELTGSAALLGTMALANAVPMLALALFGGVVADRLQKKHVLMVGQMASAIISLGIAVSIMLGLIHWTHLVAASFLQGIVMALMMPSRQSIIPEIVGQEGLMNAVALNSGGMNINRLLIPGVAGFLISFVGIEAVYLTMTGLYLIAVLFVWRLPQTGAAVIRGGAVLGNVKEGLEYIRGNRAVLTVLFLTLLTVVLSMPYMFLLPVFTKDILVIDPESVGSWLNVPILGSLLTLILPSLAESSSRLGLLISVSGFGALIGSLVIASLGNKNRGMLFLHTVLLTGVSLLAFSFSGSYFLSMFIMLFVGLGQAGRMAFSNTLVQAYTEDAYRGRVMSIYMMEFGVMQFGVFIATLFAQAFGAPLVLGTLSVLLSLTAISYYVFSPRMRRLQ